MSETPDQSEAEPLTERFSSPLSRRAMLSASTFAGLSGTYALYAALVNPLIQPPLGKGPDPDRPPSTTPPPRGSVLVAERFLSAAPWAARAQYQLRTKEAFVYFENWKRVEEHAAVRFWPFAIVWIHNPDALREGPITFVSESAMVKFVRKFEITNDPGRVIAAALEGETTIRGPNKLAIDGRNFTYSESAMRIWSDEPLTFVYGENSGSSVGMQIDLEATTEVDDNSLAVAGMRAVRLKRDVHMDLVSDVRPTPAAGASADSTTADGAPTDDADREPTRATVTSDGSFQYDVEAMVAAYEKNVRVEKPTEDGGLDTLEADKLEITFVPDPTKATAKPPEPTTPAEEPPTPETGQFRGFETSLTFRRLHAEGPNVTLRSSDHDVTATMNRLDYDAEARIVELDDDEAVRVLHEGSELRSPQITLVHAREGNELESVLCLGRGQMRHVDPKTGELDLEAKWEERMQIRPDTESDLQLLELERDAVVRQVAEGSAMQANFIRLWFDRTAAPDPPPAATDGRARNIDPRKLLAVEQVTMVGDNMRARTNRLEVWFEEPATPPPPRSTASLAPPVRSDRPHEAASQSLAAVEDRTAVERTVLRPTTQLVESKNGDGPIDFSADLVRVRAIRSAGQERANDGLDVREVWAHGNVDVRQEHADGKAPLHVTGRQMHVFVPAKNREVLHVFGSEARGEGVDDVMAAVPAHVRDRGVHMEGPAIHLDRGENRAWVDGSGLLQLPVTQQIDGTPLDEPQLLDVWWSERMDFDGVEAVFVGDVKTILENDRIRCAQMNVRLTERIDFTEGTNRPGERPERAGGRPEVANVSCRDGVTVEGHAYEGTKLVGVRRAKFWQFDLDQTTGDTLARGPGWVTLWRRDAGRGADLGDEAIVRTNGVAKADRSDWEYTRIEFEGTTAGNVHERTNRFEGLVEITYGPVAKPLDVVDPDDLPENGGWMRSETLDLKHHEKTERRPAYFTAFGEGNVYLRGRQFFARADEVAYDELKDRYVLRSKGTRHATIWREKPGGGYDVAPAKRMEFVPSRNALKLDRASSIDASG